MHLPRTLLLTLASSSLASTQQTTSPTTTLTTLSPFFNPWNPGPVLPLPSETTEAESPAEPTNTPPLTTFATLPSPSPSATPKDTEGAHEKMVEKAKEQSRHAGEKERMWKFRNWAKAWDRKRSDSWRFDPCIWCWDWDWDRWWHTSSSASPSISTSTATATAITSPEPVENLAKRSAKDWYPPHPIPFPWDEWNHRLDSIASYESEMSNQTTATLTTSIPAATASPQPVETLTKRSTKNWYPHPIPLPWVPSFDWDEWNDLLKSIASYESEMSTQTSTTPTTLPTSQPQFTKPTTSSPQPEETITKRWEGDWEPILRPWYPPWDPRFSRTKIHEAVASDESGMSTRTSTTTEPTTLPTSQAQSTEPTTTLAPQNRRDEPSPASPSSSTSSSSSSSSTPTLSFPSSLYTLTSPRHNWDSMISRLQNFDASVSPTTSSSKSPTRVAKPSFATITKRSAEMQETSEVVTASEGEGKGEGEGKEEPRIEMEKRDYFGAESGGHRVMYCPGWPTATRHNLTHFKIWHFRCFCTRYYKIERQDCSYGWAPGQFTEF
ncbi:hypothetical protein HYALB_00005946 [Hymenoscyphus albidus]|uniref:Uncharacterized protein n=1 Tax=Hymenoscyphus albidus TaxID=595503 RepID=A0A9N9LCN1_9HELO|nr:hypothetical protein HYALB_00005946 [Hymenoscyphus albidus]